VPITAPQAQKVYENAECLYSAEKVQNAIDELAHVITRKVGESDPVILCVMTGGIILTGQLLPRLYFPLQLDYVHATRYANQTQGGTLTWIAKPRVSLRDRVVIVVDDILDEGITLSEIVKACSEDGARAVYSAVLVNKRHDRKNGFEADFIGLEVDDRYVFGFGMDYKGYLRNAKGIFAARE
jgi:hypoxanthine phosphoribosyltransferase